MSATKKDTKKKMATKKTRSAKPASVTTTAAKRSSRAADSKATKSKATNTKSTKARAAKRIPDALLDELVQRAKAVRENAHAPYSRYKVGAAIATASGAIFAGCNVENASYGGTICAERGAIMQMVAAGHKDPVACAIVTSDAEGAAPCGLCRQVFSEFARDMPIALVGLGSPEGESGRVVSSAALLPLAFTADDLRFAG